MLSKNYNEHRSAQYSTQLASTAVYIVASLSMNCMGFLTICFVVGWPIYLPAGSICKDVERKKNLWECGINITIIAIGFPLDWLHSLMELDWKIGNSNFQILQMNFLAISRLWSRAVQESNSLIRNSLIWLCLNCGLKRRKIKD